MFEYLMNYIKTDERHRGFPGVDSGQIKAKERDLNYQLPVELVELYKKTNGLCLYDDTYRILPVEELQPVSEYIGRPGPPGWIALCDVQDLNFVGIVLDDPYLPIGCLVDCFQETFPEDEPEIIALSLGEFFTKVINSQGELFWLESTFTSYPIALTDVNRLVNYFSVRHGISNFSFSIENGFNWTNLKYPIELRNEVETSWMVKAWEFPSKTIATHHVFIRTEQYGRQCASKILLWDSNLNLIGVLQGYCDRGFGEFRYESMSRYDQKEVYFSQIVELPDCRYLIILSGKSDIDGTTWNNDDVFLFDLKQPKAETFNMLFEPVQSWITTLYSSDEPLWQQVTIEGSIIYQVDNDSFVSTGDFLAVSTVLETYSEFMGRDMQIALSSDTCFTWLTVTEDYPTVVITTDWEECSEISGWTDEKLLRRLRQTYTTLLKFSGEKSETLMMQDNLIARYQRIISRIILELKLRQDWKALHGETIVEDSEFDEFMTNIVDEDNQSNKQKYASEKIAQFIQDSNTPLEIIEEIAYPIYLTLFGFEIGDNLLYKLAVQSNHRIRYDEGDPLDEIASSSDIDLYFQYKSQFTVETIDGKFHDLTGRENLERFIRANVEIYIDFCQDIH